MGLEGCRPISLISGAGDEVPTEHSRVGLYMLCIAMLRDLSDERWNMCLMSECGHICIT